MHKLKVAPEESVPHRDVGHAEGALGEEIVDVSRGHALGEGLEVTVHDVLAVEGRGIEECVGWVGVEGRHVVVLALAGLAVADLPLYALVWRSV